MKNKYQVSHPAQLKTLEEKLAQQKDIATALKGSEGPGSSTTGSSSNAGSGGPSRTLATPDFEGETVPTYDTRIDLEAKPLEDFNESRTLLESLKMVLWPPRISQKKYVHHVNNLNTSILGS